MLRDEALFNADEVDGVDTVDRANDGAMSATSTRSTSSTRAAGLHDENDWSGLSTSYE